MLHQGSRELLVRGLLPILRVRTSNRVWGKNQYVLSSHGLPTHIGGLSDSRSARSSGGSSSSLNAC